MKDWPSNLNLNTFRYHIFFKTLLLSGGYTGAYIANRQNYFLHRNQCNWYRSGYKSSNTQVADWGLKGDVTKSGTARLRILMAEINCCQMSDHTVL